MHCIFNHPIHNFFLIIFPPRKIFRIALLNSAVYPWISVFKYKIEIEVVLLRRCKQLGGGFNNGVAKVKLIIGNNRTYKFADNETIEKEARDKDVCG